MRTIISFLRLVSVAEIRVHEAFEPIRLGVVTQAIQGEGMLRHPILVTPIADGSYMVLDGTHRIHALRELGCHHAVVQVVPPDELKLDSWDHVVPSGAWLDSLRRNPEFRTEPVSEKQKPIVAVVDDLGQETALYHAGGHDSLLDRIPHWHVVVDAYARAHAVHRLPLGGCERPAAGKVVVRHPLCTADELEQVVASGRLMPAGVTRFIVEGRLLNLCIPLDLITDRVVAQERWQALLDRWAGALRLYEESVYLCEAYTSPAGRAYRQEGTP